MKSWDQVVPHASIPCKGSQTEDSHIASLARLWTHLIFSTKERYPFLSQPTVRADVHAYLGTVLRNHDCPTLIVGGTEDHVHALFVLSRNHSIANIVKEVKRTSSAWIKSHDAIQSFAGRAVTVRSRSANRMSLRFVVT